MAADNLDQTGKESLERALALYEGNFLADAPDAPWTLSLRERLRRLYIRLVALRASHLIKDSHLEAAIDCYRQGLVADDLAEDFYLGIMRCYQRLSRPAEALAVYQRLRQMLSIKLGVKPSPASQTLAKTLRAS